MIYHIYLLKFVISAGFCATPNSLHQSPFCAQAPTGPLSSSESPRSQKLRRPWLIWSIPGRKKNGNNDEMKNNNNDDNDNNHDNNSNDNNSNIYIMMMMGIVIVIMFRWWFQAFSSFDNHTTIHHLFFDVSDSNVISGDGDRREANLQGSTGPPSY